ncbi:hypothetical protein A2U01_0050772 [Trifolium medium]|uniref:Uncharacterized protein n=1 Tax=Trifolium medium TaxID=97028 RepID=A0A392QYX7_9FABA|nr:hypothetical protein [Trifolium medium]
MKLRDKAHDIALKLSPKIFNEAKIDPVGTCYNYHNPTQLPSPPPPRKVWLSYYSQPFEKKIVHPGPFHISGLEVRRKMRDNSLSNRRHTLQSNTTHLN